jgi:uncharacterized protein Usg
MADKEFAARLGGAGLLTAEILYRMPDHPSLLQTFCFQTLDHAPRFPKLHHFLDYWRREIEAVIHSIRIAHVDWIGPAELKIRDAEFRLH